METVVKRPAKGKFRFEFHFFSFYFYILVFGFAVVFTFLPCPYKHTLGGVWLQKISKLILVYGLKTLVSIYLVPETKRD